MNEDRCVVKRCRERSALRWLEHNLCEEHWRELASADIEQEKELIKRWGLAVKIVVSEDGLVSRILQTGGVDATS